MIAKQITSEALLARVAERDESALGELYNRHAPGLLGMVLRSLSDRAAAEEVVEGAFLRLWSGARRVSREGASVAAWLMLTARAAAVERRRAGLKLPPHIRAKPDPLEKTLAWVARPESIAKMESRRELLKKLILQLPQPQRGILDMALFEGYTETEIARKLNEPLGKVQSGLRAGMRFLRQRLRAVLGTWSAEI
ncbi:MAG TPA: sigma-70 family RNA polymerase sigma factor [Terriglobia bacterium]|nr:sigma-70 family RNA polymerase sigma factor [Terriglobia bacterium]